MDLEKILNGWLHLFRSLLPLIPLGVLFDSTLPAQWICSICGFAPGVYFQEVFICEKCGIFHTALFSQAFAAAMITMIGLFVAEVLPGLVITPAHIRLSSLIPSDIASLQHSLSEVRWSQCSFLVWEGRVPRSRGYLCVGVAIVG